MAIRNPQFRAQLKAFLGEMGPEPVLETINEVLAELIDATGSGHEKAEYAAATAVIGTMLDQINARLIAQAR